MTYQIPEELRENNENRLTVRQLDLMMDSLSSYILEVENYVEGDTIKDEVFDLLSLIGEYRVYRLAEKDNQQGVSPAAYSELEKYFAWENEMKDDNYGEKVDHLISTMKHGKDLDKM